MTDPRDPVAPFAYHRGAELARELLTNAREDTDRGWDSETAYEVPAALVTTLDERLHDDWHEGREENGCHGGHLGGGRAAPLRDLA